MSNISMRSRSNSGVRLDYYQRLVYRTILDHQNAVSGLLPSTNQNDHAWIRDNVYSIMAVWGLSMAYKKNTDLDEDRAKTYELEQSCVKLMRGLLMAMIRQKDKVETFKETQSPLDALHAKYSSNTMLTVVGDRDWGHLQIDAISLYLLILAQMTASGLQIIFNLDEVAFVQNLVFYIEGAYCIPDYGIWERGDKTNHGLPELNASSIGLAKAALEAMSDLDLFAGRGGPSSVIHVMADEAQKCHAVLQSILPRESLSKEVDAALVAVIGFPAFAVEDPELLRDTRHVILKKLRGRYGLRRFLRDGHRTAKEDPTRLYYDPGELKVFENIECEWPLFFCYLIIDAVFRGDREMANDISSELDKIVLTNDDGLKLVPEMYTVPAPLVDLEYQNPHSQDRIAIGQCPFMWAQSLYIIGRLLLEGFIAPGELDPLNRRLSSNQKPDVVVQVVLLAEDYRIQETLRHLDFNIQTVSDLSPIEMQPARVLSHLFAYLGRNKKLQLSGRANRDVGLLSTSKLYSLHDRIFAFTPQFADESRHYIASDIHMLLDIIKNEIAFLKTNWQESGRPVLVLPIRANITGENERIPQSVLSTLKKLKSGYINGTRVVLGKLDDFLSTSCVASLSFLGNPEEGDPDGISSSVKEYLERELQRPLVPVKVQISQSNRVSSIKRKQSVTRGRRSGVSGIIKRTRSIQVDQYDPELVRLRDQFEDANRNSSFKNSSTLTLPSGEADASPDHVSSRRPRDISFFRPANSSTSRASSDDLTPTFPESPGVPDLDDDSGFPSLRSDSDRGSRTMSDLQIEPTATVEDLLSMFKETELLEEQGDILHYLAYTKGLNFDTKMGLAGQQPVMIKDLLKDVYEKACQERKWSLVRHIAGILGKRVEDLTKAVTDILVRQKQVTIGMPPLNEHTITRPIPSKELRQIINKAHGGDQSTAMLTQELLVFLAMFIRTEPQLFTEMLRLRVGLIIQVMASELGRALKCSGEEASDHLLNLSPYEMKMLLHHILSGKELALRGARSGHVSLAPDKVSAKSNLDSFVGKESSVSDDVVDNRDDRQGQWLRRRRIDGALNRVPRGFYPRVWHILEKCQGISIEGRILLQHLTREMTSEEIKFALNVEQVLNSVPQPEYRQLMVEALMILHLLVEYNVAPSLGGIVNVENLVHKANFLFLEDQKKQNGDASLCCASSKPLAERNVCNGTANICQHFYDSAPSGCFGTMTYMTRAVALTLDCLVKPEVDCNIS